MFEYICYISISLYVQYNIQEGIDEWRQSNEDCIKSKGIRESLESIEDTIENQN